MESFTSEDIKKKIDSMVKKINKQIGKDTSET